MNQKADSVLGSYRAYLPLITAVGVFFAARTLSIVVCLAVIIVCYLVSALARRAGLLKKITTTIELTRYTF
jgi:hypothetical protein